MTRLFRLKWLHASGIALVIVALLALAVIPQTASAGVDGGALFRHAVFPAISTDNYTYTSISGQVAPDSPFGPQRTSPDSGTPKHAYSPFNKTDEPPQQYEIVPGQVLIKFKPEAVPPGTRGEGALPSAETVNQLSTKYGMTDLKPAFPGTVPSTFGGASPTAEAGSLSELVRLRYQ